MTSQEYAFSLMDGVVLRAQTHTHTRSPNTGVHRESGQEDAAAFPFTLSPSRSLSSVLSLSILTAADSAASALNHSLHTHAHINKATLLKISNQHIHTVLPV